MVWLLAVLVLAGASVNGQTITETFGSGANAFSIEFVTIGNPGNAADDNGFGSVAYTYNLGKFEISRDIIDKANAGGGLEIEMWDNPSGPYPVGDNGPLRPAGGINWYEAARFVNYLNANKGYQAAYNLAQESWGDDVVAWSPGEQSSTSQYRHKDAKYFLPSRNEWYKGAYGSPDGTWYDYATGSDDVPTAVKEGSLAGTAVYAQPTYNWDGPADVNNAGGLSPYGTMAQGGNVWEWTETINVNYVDEREFIGGSFMELTSEYLASSAPSLSPAPSPWQWSSNVGFRIAMVPEPSSLSLLLAGGAVLMAGRRRRV